MHKYINFPTLITALLLLAAVTGSAGADPRAAGVVNQYFDLVISGNIESAVYLWSEADQERSSRFGIVYPGVAIKGDCTSPLMANQGYRFGAASVSVRQREVLEDRFVRVEYHMPAVDREKTYSYYTQFIDGYYWLCYPQDYYARDWPILQTRYFRIHYHPSLEEYINPVGLEELDLFVERTIDSLEMSDETLKEIAERKIEYFYCDNEQTVEKISGHLTKGLLDLASNDIVSANFPHYHELTHLMVNIKLKELPLYTIPILREGVAVRYGGRWGKTAAALMDLGAYLYQEQLLDLDSILSYRDFQTSAVADISYPVAGLFAGYLADRLGQDKFFQLYLEASGSFEEVNELDMVDIQNMIIGYTGHDSWLDLRLDFGANLKKRVAKDRVVAPGPLENGKQLLAEDVWQVKRDKEWYSFEFTLPPSSPAAGNLLFDYDERLAEKPSLLFAEQYPGQSSSDGYRFGVRFDQHEAGLYDYATNQLLAKYIWGITPSAEYFDEEANRVAIRFRKDLVEDYLADEVRCRLLPN